jgi:hypothetical protein
VDHGQTLIERCLQYLEAMPLETADYRAAINQIAILNLLGGGIFDALIAQAALRTEVDRMLTLNPDHFNRLNAEIARITVVP